MNLTHLSDRLRRIRSLFPIILLTAFVLLGSVTRLEAKDLGVKVFLIDKNEKPLEAAKITIVTKCPCDPCEKEDCWVYCCSPDKFSPKTLATDTTATGGVFKLEAGQLAPGNYTIKVESGRVTKDIDIRVEQNQKLKLIKAPGVKKMHSFGEAYEVELSTVKAG
jgi:hypothetical protein